MNRPAFLQILRSGVLLSRKNFPGFVNTWNWLVFAFDSFCGDGDLNPQQGKIIVDRSNPSMPVIRFKDESESKGNSALGNFAYDESNMTIAVGAFFIARKFYFTSSTYTIQTGFTGKVYLQVPMDNASVSSATIVTASDWPSNPTDDWMYVPLYSFENGSVVGDFRGAPFVQEYE